MAFFKKVACFTDIHFGMKGNSRVHNDDCEAFVYWFIEQAKAHGCETCIFLGCLLYTSPSPRDQRGTRMPSSA